MAVIASVACWIISIGTIAYGIAETDTKAAITVSPMPVVIANMVTAESEVMKAVVSITVVPAPVVSTTMMSMPTVPMSMVFVAFSSLRRNRRHENRQQHYAERQTARFHYCLPIEVG